MIKEYSRGIPHYKFENLSRFEELQHFITTKEGGFTNGKRSSLNMSFSNGDAAETVVKNRQAFFGSLDLSLGDCVFTDQIHKANIKIVKTQDVGKGAFNDRDEIVGTDGLITSDINLCVCVTTADCLPIIFYDDHEKVISVAHAGWRGTRDRISVNVINLMIDVFGSNPKNIFVGIGPSIGPNDFEVGKEVALEFLVDEANTNFVSKKSDEKYLVNLWEINISQILSFGIPRENIELAGVSTYQSTEFYSYRTIRSNGAFLTGAVIKK